MERYNAAKVRYIKRLHREHKKAGNLPQREHALAQYKTWVAAIADPGMRPILRLQPFGTFLLIVLFFIGWATLVSAIFAGGLLIWGLLSWNMALLLTSGLFFVQALISSIVQTSINTELGARIEFLMGGLFEQPRPAS